MNKSKFSKSYITLITIIMVLATVFASQVTTPIHQDQNKNTSCGNTTLTKVPQIITPDNSAHSYKHEQSIDGSLLVENSAVKGLKINKNRKYIPEKNKSIKANDDKLILFVKYADEESVRESLNNLGLSLIRILQSDGTVIASNINNVSAKKLNKRAAQDANILYIMDNCIRIKRTVKNLSTVNVSATPGMQYIPNDPHYDNLWYLSDTNGISINKAWETTKGSDDILVAVIDSGIVTSHQEFAGRIYKQYDVADNDGSAEDNTDFSHGSHIAGIIAANADNNVGICGIASSAKLLIIDAFLYDEDEDEEYATDSDIFTAYELCIDENANVVNMSFGGFTEEMDFMSSRLYNSKLSNLRKNNIVSVAAAGNDNTSDKVLPSDSDYVISVIATDENDKKCDFSNYGISKDISAPGENILSIGNSTEYAWADGTSMATPIVTGVVALLLSVKKDLTPEQVENILYSSATRLGNATSTSKDPNFGYGKINAAAAMTLLEEMLSSDIVPATITPNTPNSTQTPKATKTPDMEVASSVSPSTTPEATNNIANTQPSDTVAITPAPQPTEEITPTPTKSSTTKVSVKFTRKNVKIKVGRKKVLNVKVKGAKKVRFSVNKKGKKRIKLLRKKAKKITVKAKRKGKAIVWAKASNKISKCKIKVV